MSETIYSQPYAVKIPPILVAKDRQVGHKSGERADIPPAQSLGSRGDQAGKHAGIWF